MGPRLSYMLAVCAITAVVVWIGSILVGAGNVGVYVGAVMAAGFQIAAYSTLGLGVLKEKRFIAFLMQMVGRLAVLGITAFVLVPGLALPPEATLLTLVTVFFATTLIEPVFMHPRLRTGS